MKQIFLIILTLLQFHLFCQEHNNIDIEGCYWGVGLDIYYVIDSLSITELNVRDRYIYGGNYSVTIVAAKYQFINDTLTFNFGLFEDKEDWIEHKWVYSSKTKNFLGVGFGEYVRVKPESVNKKLKPFNLQLIE